MYAKQDILTSLTSSPYIEILEEATSTNDYIKAYSHLDNAVVIAKSQTSGRGRLNRKFYSPKNAGVYMSVLIKPSISTAKSTSLTTYTAVVVANAIEKLSNHPVQIKWVNDLYMNGKKVCGVLAEAVQDYEKGILKHAIIGIGINVFKNDFDEEIKNIATSIEEASHKKIDVNKLIAYIVDGLLNAEQHLLSGDFMEEYKARQIIFNKKISVLKSNESYEALALDVLDDGSLLIDKNGEIFTLNHGEISIKV